MISICYDIKTKKSHPLTISIMRSLLCMAALPAIPQDALKLFLVQVVLA